MKRYVLYICTSERLVTLAKHRHDRDSPWYTRDNEVVPTTLHHSLRVNLHVPENIEDALHRHGRCLQVVNPDHPHLKEQAPYSPPDRSWHR